MLANVLVTIYVLGLAVGIGYVVVEVISYKDKPEPVLLGDVGDTRAYIYDCARRGGVAHVKAIWNRPAGEPQRRVTAWIVSCEEQDDE